MAVIKKSFAFIIGISILIVVVGLIIFGRTFLSKKAATELPEKQAVSLSLQNKITAAVYRDAITLTNIDVADYKKCVVSAGLFTSSEFNAHHGESITVLFQTITSNGQSMNIDALQGGRSRTFELLCENDGKHYETPFILEKKDNVTPWSQTLPSRI